VRSRAAIGPSSTVCGVELRYKTMVALHQLMTGVRCVGSIASSRAGTVGVADSPAMNVLSCPACAVAVRRGAVACDSAPGPDCIGTAASALHAVSTACAALSKARRPVICAHLSKQIARMPCGLPINGEHRELSLVIEEICASCIGH